jgi:hypothetical protein
VPFLAIIYRSVFKFGIMFCIVKLIRVLCDQSSIFSVHQIPIWELRINVMMFLRAKKYFPFARKNITPPLKVKRYSCLKEILQKLE